MKLYELSTTFADLFDQFDEINTYTPDKDADGNYINDDGEIIRPRSPARELPASVVRHADRARGRV